ncbi:hypothetical protein [Mesorhizobium sp. LNJC405B00]|uniref:hypothetical protein n=1 Tax=Mesorhizobium sp. LNJC405B00 TaxID=1287281 RepID=UPI0003CE637C|nr:hypothetical protein [Mesorhizobium sp. LNJC405B00]ESY01399.1 hypothetical protein X755_07010 [Mesorhizobium sp. LNJC405B00]
MTTDDVVPRAPSLEAVETSREDLYEQVWATPINHLAEKFGVSGSYLARVCEALNVPRPPVGYWQKKAVGKDKSRPELPTALPGDQLTWSKDKPLAVPVKNRVRRKPDGAVMTKTISSGRHPMLIGVEGHFRKSRNVEEGEFLRPYKYLLPDIVASEDLLVRALDVANEVYTAFDKKGHRVLFAPPGQRMGRVHIEEREVPEKDRKYGRYSSGSIWSPHRPTITYIESVPIGLALTEMTERTVMRYVGGKYIREDSKVIKSAKSWQLANSWTTEQDLPCGRFRLVAYSPLNGVDWVESWQETAKSSISAMIPAIVRKLESAKDELQTLMTAAEEAAAQRQREWEEAHERYLREEDQRRVKQAMSESQKQLSDIMDRWAAAMSVERFFQDAERRIEDVESQRRVQLMERLALARTMLGTMDPLDYLEGWLAPEERYKSKYS